MLVELGEGEAEGAHDIQAQGGQDPRAGFGRKANGGDIALTEACLMCEPLAQHGAQPRPDRPALKTGVTRRIGHRLEGHRDRVGGFPGIVHQPGEIGDGRCPRYALHPGHPNREGGGLVRGQSAESETHHVGVPALEGRGNCLRVPGHQRQSDDQRGGGEGDAGKSCEGGPA